MGDGAVEPPALSLTLFFSPSPPTLSPLPLSFIPPPLYQSSPALSLIPALPPPLLLPLFPSSLSLSFPHITWSDYHVTSTTPTYFLRTPFHFSATIKNAGLFRHRPITELLFDGKHTFCFLTHQRFRQLWSLWCRLMFLLFFFLRNPFFIDPLHFWYECLWIRWNMIARNAEERNHWDRLQGFTVAMLCVLCVADHKKRELDWENGQPVIRRPTETSAIWTIYRGLRDVGKQKITGIFKAV